ncbi:hypothetical protein Vafri_6085, partial [Volvox africanus]
MPRLRCGHGHEQAAFFLRQHDHYAPAQTVTFDTGFTGTFAFSQAFIERNGVSFKTTGAPSVRAFDRQEVQVSGHLTASHLLIEMEYNQAISISAPRMELNETPWPVILGQEADIVVGLAFLDGCADFDLQVVDSAHRFVTISRIVPKAVRWRVQIDPADHLAYAHATITTDGSWASSDTPQQEQERHMFAREAGRRQAVARRRRQKKLLRKWVRDKDAAQRREEEWQRERE